MGRQRLGDDLAMDMTPMIDVVFQLIIFFVVTTSLQQKYNMEVNLEKSPNGPILKGEDVAFIVEVDKRGWLSMHGVALKRENLRALVRSRFNRFGEFPVLIRGDSRTRHQDIRAVMDVCSEEGIAKISFIAVKEKKGR